MKRKTHKAVSGCTAKCLAGVAAIAVLCFLVSCSAFTDLERLGIGGWLGLGAVGKTTESPIPTQTAETDKTPQTTDETPETSINTGAPSTKGEITSLPVIPACPSVSAMLDGYLQTPPENKSLIRYISGEPCVYSLYPEIVGELERIVKNKYGISVSTHDGVSGEEIEKLLAGGKYFTDLLYIPLSDARKYAEKGYLSAIDTKAINSENGSFFTLSDQGEEVYYLVPSFSVAYESALVLYCNTDLLSRAGCEYDVQALAKNGEWSNEILTEILSFALSECDEKPLVSTFGEEKTKFYLSGLFEGDESGSFYIGDSDKSEAIKDFYNGNAAFLLAEVSDIRSFSDSADSYSVLPLPYKNENGEYNVIYNADSLYVASVPSSAVNKETALFLSDSCANTGIYAFRYEFADSLYNYYLRRSGSTAFMYVNRMSGKAM